MTAQKLTYPFDVWFVETPLTVVSERVIPLVPTTTIWEFALTILLVVAIIALLVIRLLDMTKGLDIQESNSVRGSGTLGFVSNDEIEYEPENATVAHPDEPVEFLPDEDRIIRMLESNGGRLQQLQFVEETEWSKSKVSRLLSKMEENNQIEKISMGRENLITLPRKGTVNDRFMK